MVLGAPNPKLSELTTMYAMFSRILTGLAILVGLSGGLLGCQQVDTSQPSVEQGSIDVSAWPFDGDRYLLLNGDWRFYWGELLSPGELDGAGAGQLLKVPGKWNHAQRPDEPSKEVGALGVGTYVLKLKGFNADTPRLGLQVPPIATAYKLYWIVDGEPSPAEPLIEVGLVDEEHSIPKWEPIFVELPATNAPATLVIQVANHRFVQGGIFYPFISIHASQPLKLAFSRMDFISIAAVGILILMLVYQLGLFIARPADRSTLAFGAFCFLMLLQMVAYRHWLTVIVFPEVTHWAFDLEMFCMSVPTYLGVAVFISFLHAHFPHEISEAFERVAWVIAIALTAYYPLAALDSNLTLIFGLSSGLQGLWILGAMLRAIWAGREGARLVLGGFVFLFCATGVDLLTTQQVIETSFVLAPIGMIGFIVMHNIVQARRFATAFSQAEHLSQNLQQAVEQRTAELALKTKEALEINEALETANSQLRTMDAQKTAFFQNVSHELRTPLTLILNPLEQALEDRPDDGELQVVARNARRLLRLVNQLLQFQRLKAGRAPLNLSAISVVPFICEIEALSTGLLNRRGLRWESSFPDQSVVVDADKDALEKIVFNFVSNAAKFSPQGGTIRLAVSISQDRVKIAVSDEGPGISADDQENLFQVFSQVGQAHPRPEEGSGLGLAITRELAEAHGGAVGVESREGVGATFWVELPLSESEEGDQALSLSLTDSVVHWPKEDEEAHRFLVPENGSTGPKVLVVDDVEDMRQLVAGVLRKQGYQVETAVDGVDGLEKLRHEQFEIVVTDWMMPRLDGPALIEYVRGDPELRGIPIVLLTARSDEESRLMGVGVGADAFLGKPFQSKELTSLVRNLIALKESEGLLREAYRELKASTEREVLQMQRLVSQSEQLAGLGQLVSGVGYEIANPVSQVHLSSEETLDVIDELEDALMEVFEGEPEKLGLSTQLIEQLDAMRESIGQTRSATKLLQNVSQALQSQSRHEVEPETTLIQEVLEEAVTLASGRLKHCQIEIKCAELEPIECYRTQLGTAFSTILTASAESIIDRVSLERAGGNRHYRGRVTVHGYQSVKSLKPGLRLHFEDNGQTLSDEEVGSFFLEQVAERTDGRALRVGQGWVLKIIERHGGTIEVLTPESGDGRVLEVWLPLRVQLSDDGDVRAL